MHPDVTSKSLRSSSELTLVASIKPGFVAGLIEPVTYATRLHTLFGTLFGLRQIAEEQLGTEHIGPLERLRVLHFVRYAIFDDDRRLLLAVSFDHSWESYMRGLVDNAAPMLDAIFCHCDDYAGHACSEGYDGFASWVRAHQINADFFYAAEPDLTVDDLRHLKQRARLPVASQISLEEQLARLHVGDPDLEDRTAPDPRRAFEMVAALERLSQWFPKVAGDPHADRVHFDATTRELLRHFKPWLEKLSEAKDKLAGFDLLRPVFEYLADAVHLEPSNTHHATDIGAAEYDQIQGNIVTPYEAITHGCLALVQCENAAAAQELLRTLAAKISYEQTTGEAGDWKLNVALTASGLRTLGLSDWDLQRFPKEFRDGMAQRAGLLGDVVSNHPAHWKLPAINWPRRRDAGELDARVGSPIPLDTVDVVLLVQAIDPRSGEHSMICTNVLRDIIANADSDVRILHVQSLHHLRDAEGAIREHFGFVDNLSQPRVDVSEERTPPSARIGDETVALGELVLGYPNDHGDVLPPPPTERRNDELDLFKNGSFLVVRKLKQNVSTFLKLEADNIASFEAAGVADAATAVSNTLMGRNKDGTPAIAPSNPSDPNQFDYEADQQGQVCPFHAHIRRANPRRPAPVTGETRELRPCIARRSLSYGASDSGPERGLMFMAYNASIANQYEVIQSWLNGGNSTGQLSAQNDLLTGAWRDDRPPYRVLNEGRVVELKLPDKPLVELEWGMYLFVPSRAALSELAAAREPQRDAQDPQLVQQGNAIIAKLMLLGEQEGKREWKRVLEDPSPPLRAAAAAVWAAIRASGGALRTPYGVLVGDAAEVRRVLADDKTFSVREYYERMNNSCGPVQLGMDPGTPAHLARSLPNDVARDRRYERDVTKGSYERAAAEPNQYIHRISLETAFGEARDRARKYIDTLVQEQHAFAQLSGTVLDTIQVDVKQLAFRVVEQLADLWFGLPQGLMGGFTACSFDSFRPNPEAWVQDITKVAGKQIQAAYREYVRTLGRKDGKLAQHLCDTHQDFQDREIAQALIGAVLGFTGPTIGSFMSVMNRWIESDRLARLQQWWLTSGQQLFAGDFIPASNPLQTALIETMQQAPVPDLLHRTCLRDVPVGANGASVSTRSGERVVVSIASAAAQCPVQKELLFGGDYKDKRGLTHACPGQPMAIGVMLGLIAALLDQQSLRRAQPLVLTFAPTTVL